MTQGRKLTRSLHFIASQNFLSPVSLSESSNSTSSYGINTAAKSSFGRLSNFAIPEVTLEKPEGKKQLHCQVNFMAVSQGEKKVHCKYQTFTKRNR